MPVSATTVLPTSSNIKRGQELEDISIMTSLGESNTVTEPENTNNFIAVAKKRKIAAGTTAKVLQQCQEEMKEYRKSFEKRQEKQNDVLMQVLETYKAIKDRHEIHMTAIQNLKEKALQQTIRRNDLMDERNNLLKELVYSLKKIQNKNIY